MDLVGKKIDDRYEVKALISTNDYLETFRCYDTTNNKLVLVKVFVLNILDDEKRNISKSEIEQCLSELMSINDSKIHRVLDFSIGNLFQYVVCEFVDDISLERFLSYKKKQGKLLEWEDILNISKQLCDATKTLHDKGIIHGSISPSTVLMRRTQGFNYLYEVKLTDALCRSFVSSDNSKISTEKKQSLLYDAPEVLSGNPVDCCSDIYSIGVVLYKITKGFAPFENEDIDSIVNRKKNSIFCTYNGDVPKGFCQIIEHALALHKKDRYSSIDELCDDLETITHNQNVLFNFSKTRKRNSKSRKKQTRRNTITPSQKIEFTNESTEEKLKVDNKPSQIAFKERKNKMDYRFRCPYCFGEMSHTDVLFRGVTIFNKEEFDASGAGRQRSDIEIIQDDNERNKLLNEYDKREFFSAKYDPVYHNWYKVNKFGTTSENPGGGDIPVYDRPIIKPHENGTSGLIFDEDGFAIELRDPWDEPTRERVCIHCHNPLPLGYGKFPVRFISVIGISGAGKTVFLSKLIQYISQYTAQLKLATTPSPSSVEFVRKNPVKEGSPLPAPTVRMQLEQPLSYNVKFRNGENETFVIYDIAGENCEKTSDLLKYGKFVVNSNGIILIIDPVKELGIEGGEGDNKLDLVLDNINALFGKAGLNDIPLAVCISKSDLMKGILESPKFFDKVETVKNKFNAQDYNEISKELNGFLNSNAPSTKVKLDENYSRYNFFAFTTLGCATKKTIMHDDFGNEYEAEIPKNPPNPKRIEEPLFWLFKQFGYIESTGDIFTPRNEENIQLREELVEKIKELQKELNTYPRLCVGKKARQKDDLNKKILALQSEITEIDRRIRQFAQ